MCFQLSSWDSRIRKVTVCVWTIVAGMRDLAFSEPKAFLAWFMLQSIPAGPYPGLPPPPPGYCRGFCLPCQPRRGMAQLELTDTLQWWWRKIYVKILSCCWHNLSGMKIIQKVLQAPIPVYIYIGDFSSGKGVHDSLGVWIPLHGFWIPATGFFVSGT